MENLLNSISKMLDEKLKPIQEHMNRLENKVDVLELDISKLKQVQERIEKKLDNVVKQTANLIEFKTEVNTKLDALKEVKEVTKENCYEIAKIKSVM